MGALTFLISSPHIFAANTLIILFTLSISLLLRRRLTFLFFACLLWLILGITNAVVLTYRSSPLSAIDFLIVKSALDIMDLYLSTIQIVLIIVGIVAVIALGVVMFIKCPRCHVNYKKSIVCVVLTAILTVGLGALAVPVNASDYETAELSDSYDSYGFVYCFTRSILSQGVKRPGGYSSDKANEIIDALKNTSDSTVSDKLPNVIYVQLESFFDVKYVKDVEFSEDPTPNFTALKENNISGFMRVPHIGGGTANIEFEVLTGMNLDHFGFGEFPYTTVLQDRACESLAANLKTLGYSAHAIHTYIATFYDRHKVYPNLGFDTFTSIEMMSDVTKNVLSWVHDRNLIKEINSALDSTNTPDFVFAVSVQAHGRYPDEPLSNQGIFVEKGPIDVYNITDEKMYYQYDFYVNEIHDIDKFIGDLCDSLESRGEPCVVVFYGDHLPALSLTDDMMKNGSAYETEYVIWSNTELQGIDNSVDPNTYDRDLEAYMLSAYVGQLCGIHVGDITLLHQNGFKTGEPYDDALHTLEYAQLYDERGSKYAQAQMTFGTQPITVESYSVSDGTLYVKGTGFNKYSTVKLDGVKRNTLFIDSNTLAVENVLFSNSKPDVVQIADDGTELAYAVKTYK